MVIDVHCDYGASAPSDVLGFPCCKRSIIPLVPSPHRRSTAVRRASSRRRVRRIFPAIYRSANNSRKTPAIQPSTGTNCLGQAPLLLPGLLPPIVEAQTPITIEVEFGLSGPNFCSRIRTAGALQDWYSTSTRYSRLESVGLSLPRQTRRFPTIRAMQKRKPITQEQVFHDQPPELYRIILWKEHPHKTSVRGSSRPRLSRATQSPQTGWFQPLLP